MTKYINPFALRCLLALTGLVMLMLAKPAMAAESASGFTLRFCTPGVDVTTVDVKRDCTLPTRPDLPDDYGYVDQLVLLTIDARDAAARLSAATESIWITPYYLNQLVIFAQEGDDWQPVAEGGAALGPSLVSAHLGGHRFEVPIKPGVNEFLLEIYAPHFAHLSIRPDQTGQITNKQEVLLSMHLGMLILLFVLVVSAWLIRPAALEARLAFLTGCVLLSVVIGSGAIYRIWPSASVHWVGFFMFNTAVALRIGAITWVYASLIGPYNDRKSYRVLNATTYVVTAVAIVLFASNLPSLGWPLVALLLLLALFAPAWGLFTAKPMPKLLSGAILGSVLFYLALNIFAFYSLMNTSGQNDWPVYAIRVVDLALPLILFAVVILRNRVADRELEQARVEIANQQAQLDTERRVSEEKRMLLDMLTHEIKNPLASIRFAIRNLSRMDEGQVDIRARKIAGIQSSVQSIDEIIDRCNLANGLEDESIEPQLEAVDVGALVSDLVQASEQRDRIDLSCGSTPMIQSDPYLIKIVIANLLDNANKYALKGSMVTVAVQEMVTDAVTSTDETDRICVRVSNEIEPGAIPDTERLFDRYYRHESARHVRGSGLGLPLSRSVCQLLGAELVCRLHETQIEFEVRFEAT